MQVIGRVQRGAGERAWSVASGGLVTAFLVVVGWDCFFVCGDFETAGECERWEYFC